MLQVPSPKVVLASTSDMECGFSRDLFAQWCVNGKNTIILTSRAADGTLTSDLVKNGGNRNIGLLTGKRVKLSGQELEEHKRKEKEKEKVKEEVGDIDEDSSSDEEMEITTTKPTANLKNVKHDIIMRVRNKILKMVIIIGSEKRIPYFYDF